MQNTSSNIVDQLMLMALVIPYLLIVGTLLGGMVRGCIFYSSWLKQQSLSQRMQLGLLHLSPILGVVLIYLANQFHVPDFLGIIAVLLVVFSILGHLLTLSIVSILHGLTLVHKSYLGFKTAFWWQKVLLIVVPTDLLWSLLSRG